MIIAMGKQKNWETPSHQHFGLYSFSCVLVKVIVDWNHSNRSIIYINIWTFSKFGSNQRNQLLWFFLLEFSLWLAVNIWENIEHLFLQEATKKSFSIYFSFFISSIKTLNLWTSLSWYKISLIWVTISHVSAAYYNFKEKILLFTTALC